MRLTIPPFMSIKSEIIEIIDKNTHQKKFLIKTNNRWDEITEEQYNKIVRGKKNGKHSNNR